MTPNRHWFKTYTKMRKEVRLADHTVIYTEGVGSVVFKPVIDGKPAREVEFARVLHVPDLQNNLFSVLYLTQHRGFDVHISKSTMKFEKDGHIPFVAKVGDDNVGYLVGETIIDQEYVNSAVASSTLPLDLTLWHRRLAHHGYESVKNMVHDSMVEGLTMTSNNKPDPICEPCLAGKMHANPFPSSKNRSQKLLEHVHTDVHKVGTTTHSGYQYWVTFIDDYSRLCIVLPIKTKDMVFDAFKQFKAYAENQTGHKIKALRDVIIREDSTCQTQAILVEADDDDNIQVPLHEPQGQQEEQQQEEEEDVQPDAEAGAERPVTPPPRPVPVQPEAPLAQRRERRNVQPPGEWWKVKPSALRFNDDDEGEEAEFVHTSSLTGNEPNSYAEAMAGPDAQRWHEAALEELNAQLRNGTWVLEKLPPGKKAIGSRWVFRIKRNADGTVERFKARIVAKGYNQRPGFDYMEIFAPTMHQATIRLILALAAIDDLHLRSVDISHAFINGDIDADVYMMQPEGFKELGSEYVCRLNKSIYGLKQAARLWNEKLHSALLDMGFNRICSDPALYTLASNSQAALGKVVSDLSKYFKLKDLGETSYLLGVAIRRDRANRKIYLSQKQYIMDILKRFGMDNCSTVDTPMNPGLRLSRDQCPKSDEERQEMKDIPYISAVGSVMYLAMMTRPDIAEPASVLARFNSNPGMAHWKAVKHLLRYLAGTLDMELELGPDPDCDELIRAYADADHGGNKDNGKSTTGYIIKMGSGAVSWSSKLQPIVALSTTDAEYVAACAAGKEIRWMQKLLGEMGYTVPKPTKLFMDNQSAISVAKNPEHHGRMKHLDLCFYWLRDKVEQGFIEPVYLQTDQMPADLLTKALPRVKVMLLRRLMGLVM
jgi:hypothetical protein